MKTTEILKSAEMQSGDKLRNELSEQNINVSYDWVIKVYPQTIEFILVDEYAQRIFGGEVMVTGYKNYAEDQREIKINTGSMGGFDIDCQASTQKVFLMNSFLTKWEEFKAVCAWCMEDAKNKEVNKIINKYI
tara:strand:+ start:453 stop:851 length:399 start_codon:yes stop_codon:yes gene_type:complete